MKTLISMAIAAAMCASAAVAQTLVKETDVIASGATDATNGTLHLQGTIGQAVIGPTYSAGNIIGQGFWHAVAGVSQVEITRNGPPTDFVLKQNYPNPFSASTTIEFSIPNAEHVTLRVYALTGALVKTLVDDKMGAGNYTVQYTPDDLMTGAFLYSLQAGSRVVTKRMVLIR